MRYAVLMVPSSASRATPRTSYRQRMREEAEVGVQAVGGAAQRFLSLGFSMDGRPGTCPHDRVREREGWVTGLGLEGLRDVVMHARGGGRRERIPLLPRGAIGTFALARGPNGKT